MTKRLKVNKKVIKRLLKVIPLGLLLITISITFFLQLRNKKYIQDHKGLALENYSEIEEAIKNVDIYDELGNVVGKILKDSKVLLDGMKDRQYKLKGTNYYIDYRGLKKNDDLGLTKHTEYSDYKNYIPYNISVVTNDTYSLYRDNNEYIKLNGSSSYPIIIRLSDKYGIEFNDQLFYIKKEDVKEEKESNNTDKEIANDLAVLNYHYTVNKEAGEFSQCLQDICMEDKVFEEELKYLSDNNYYSVSMRDVYLYTTGAIQLPKRSVTITIDDGWFVDRSVILLEKYKQVGTLFLIGSLLPANAYQSDYLEIHSHTWNMHNLGECPGYFGGAITCKSREYILEDLKKSRESLNNTTVFCFPFYEYNSYALALIKEAGFEMAFVGGERSVRVGDNLFELPRYVMFNHTSLQQFISYIS